MDEENNLIDSGFTPFWQSEGGESSSFSDALNVGYDSRSAIMNDNMQANNDREEQAKADYYAAKKQAEVQNTMFGGTALANTPNHNTETGQRTSAAKALATFGVSLLTAGLAGAPVGIAAAAGLNQAAKQYGRDMNRSYRLNQALNGQLDNYTDLSIQDYIMSGNRDGLMLLEEENSQIRKFNERADKQQYIGSGDVFTKLTGLDATEANGYQGAGLYGKQWDSFENKYGNWFKAQDTRQTEANIRRLDNPAVGSGSAPKAFAGSGTQFVDRDGNTRTLYRMNDGTFRDASNNPVDVVGEGLQESDTREIDYAYSVLKNQDSYSQDEVKRARQIVGQSQELDLNRGKLSRSEYKEADEQLFADSNAIRLTDTLASMADDLAKGGHSARGLSIQEWVNSFTEVAGFTLGNQEAERLYNRLNSGDLEVVRELAQAFRPVSDSQIKLVQDSLRGSTMEARAESLATTRNNLADSMNRNLERYQGTYGASFAYDPYSFDDNRGADFSGAQGGGNADPLGIR